MFIRESYYTNRVEVKLPQHESLRVRPIAAMHALWTMSSRKEEAGRRVRQLRQSKGLTQAELASQVPGLSGSRLGNYEQGTRSIDTDIAVALARHFDVSVSFILAIDDESILAPRERALLSAFRATDDRGKDTIVRVAESQPVTSQPDDQAKSA